MDKAGPGNRLQDPHSRVRVTDVARLAECAPATVSRVLNNPAKVSPEKRTRVEQAMQKLGYVRNHAARALRSQRSHMVGVLIPTLDYAIYASLVGAASRRLSAAGISTLIATFDYDLQAELAEARLLIERGAEALILIGQQHRADLYALLDQHDVLFVNTYTLDPQRQRPTVGFDNMTAAGSIARHLLYLGHRQIGVISGRTHDNDRTTNRLTGIRQVLEEQGVTLDPERVVERPYSIAHGREACALLLSRGASRPTALICGNDVLALGAIAECAARGLRVPDDISIVGFDNLEMARYSTPPLTTVEVPSDRMGEAAAGYLLDRLEGSEECADVRIEVQLILRGTTAPPAARPGQ